MKTKMKNSILILGIISVIFTSCKRIDAGHEGILIKQYGSDKGVQDVTLVTGRVWYNPWTEDVEQYATFIQTVDYDAFNVNAKDGSEFIVDPTLSFYIVQGNSSEIFKKYRKDLEEVAKTTIYNYVKDAFRLQMNKYTTDEIVSNREKFETDVQSSLSSVLEKEGFKLEQLTSGLKYPQTIVEAVNAKNKAVQDAMKVENELRVTEAQAKKLIVQAEAEKKANELKQVSLTPMLIQQQFIEKWDGHTPLYGNSPTLFQNIK
jgi:regulator of protease activity HflC (stomatin/prohibitin superfamily)